MFINSNQYKSLSWKELQGFIGGKRDLDGFTWLGDFHPAICAGKCEQDIIHLDLQMDSRSTE